ncbi:MAG: hypothetical protein Q9218_006622, partial [Villophora microphyllina]
MAQIGPKEGSAIESKLSPEMRELARRIYDEHRHYVPIAPGMVNQVYRNGLIAKKTIDRDHYIRMQGSKNYYREYVDGGLVVHRDDTHLHLGSCKTFAHPPYGSNREYRGEKGQDYNVRLTLAELATGTDDCGFCTILYQGIQDNRKFWILKWARIKWIDSHPHSNPAEAGEKQPWFEEYWSFIQGEQSVNEEEISLFLKFPKGHPYVDVHMNMAPFHFAPENALREPIADLEYYTTPGAPSPWAAFGPAPHIDSWILHNECINQILDWMNNCEENHLACTQRVEPGAPSRLLRINWPTDETSEKGQPPHVRLEATNSGVDYQYVALSHCWANTKPLMTVDSNIAEHGIRVPWDKLSQAIREAIVLTCALGLEYIWIDSLCIIQNDVRDWENELTNMGMVYGNAAVVFAAHGPDLGFEKVPLRPIQDPGKPKDNPVYCRQKIAHRSLFSAPIDTDSWFGRAWCMQERIFARRIVHFGGFCEELYFECNKGVTCECSRVSGTTSGKKHDDLTLKSQVTTALRLIREHPESLATSHELWATYVKICEDYTARGVTYANDTLPAISALMGTLARYLGEYYAGLWQRHFLLSLQWEALDTSQCSRQETFVAPSFSWASRSGAVI